jgi:hypothetical protein
MSDVRDMTDVPALVSLTGLLRAAERRNILVPQKDRRQSLPRRKVARANGRRGLERVAIGMAGAETGIMTANVQARGPQS